MDSNNSKFKSLDELKAKMAAKQGGAGGGFGGRPSGSGFGTVGGGFGGRPSGAGFGGVGGAKPSGAGFGSVGGQAGGGFNAGVGGAGGFAPRQAPRERQVEEMIEEVQETGPGKLFDYDMDQTDSNYLPPKDITKPIMVAVIAVVCLVFGLFIGWCWNGILNDRNSVNERIEVAKQTASVVDPKIEAFQGMAQLFKQRSESLGAGVLEYDEDFHKNVVKRYAAEGTFVLDISKDLPSNTFVMATNGINSPLSDIRGYAAGTTLLEEVMKSHVALTEKDISEIENLLRQSSARDKNVIYALKLNAEDLLTIVTPMAAAENFDRMLKAVTCTEVYRVTSAITDDEEASRVFKQLLADGKITEEQAKARTYDPAAQNKGKAKGKGAKAGDVAEDIDPNLVLPNRLMYRIEDRNGKQQVVFADEIILVERTKLFAGSSNALDRYRKRMMQVLALMGEVEKTTDGLYNRIHSIAVEPKM